MVQSPRSNKIEGSWIESNQTIFPLLGLICEDFNLTVEWSCRAWEPDLPRQLPVSCVLLHDDALSFNKPRLIIYTHITPSGREFLKFLE
jgi:hypothetical protein